MTGDAGHRDPVHHDDAHQDDGSQRPGDSGGTGSGSDAGLLAALRVMWQRRDPVPVGLVESVLAVIGDRDLNFEYELLTLVDSTDRLAGVRGTTETRTLTFTSGPVTVMLRVAERPAGRRRVDGWVSPPAVLAVRLSCEGADVHTTSDAKGRFELADVQAGTATMWLTASAPAYPSTAPGPGAVDDDTATLKLTTAPFTL